MRLIPRARIARAVRGAWLQRRASQHVLGTHRDLFSSTYAGPEQFCLILVTFAFVDTRDLSPGHRVSRPAPLLSQTLADVGEWQRKFQPAADMGWWGRRSLWVWAPKGAWLRFPAPHALQQIIRRNANEMFDISRRLKEGE